MCEREIRAKDNFALQFALQKSKELNLPLKIIQPKINYEHLPKEKFIIRQLIQVQQNFAAFNLDFEIINKTPQVIIKTINPALLIIDFNPILKRTWLKNVDFKVIEIDGHNIVPARYVSDKHEYSAATIRAKIYHNIYPFLTEFKAFVDEKVEVGQIEKIVTKKAKKLLESMKLFDIYRSEKLGENKKSVAYSLIFRDKNKTLSDEEINSTMEVIIYELEKTLGAELRK